MCAMAHRSFTVSPHLLTSAATNLPSGDRFSVRFPIKNVKLEVFIFVCPYTYRDIAISAVTYFAA